MLASFMIYFTPETEIDQLKPQIMLQPEKLDSTVSKDILILAGAAIVLFIIFSFLALSEFLESLQ